MPTALYAAYLRDPDGNKICAYTHRPVRAMDDHRDRLDQPQRIGGMQGVYRHASARDRHRHDLLGLRAAAAPRREAAGASGICRGSPAPTPMSPRRASIARACAELGLIFVAPDTSPRGEGVPDDPRPMISARAPASTSMRPRRPSPPTYRMYSYVTEELPALIAAQFPGRHGRGRGSSAIRWAATARSRSRCAIPAAIAVGLAPSRRSSRRCQVPVGREGARPLSRAPTAPPGARTTRSR